MPLDVGPEAPLKFPNPDYLTLDSWKRGVISVIDKSRLPKDALEEADNLFLYEDGNPGPRPGVAWYGVALPNGAAIDGFDYFDFGGVIHLVAVGGGVVYRSTDNAASWTICTGATLTSGVTVNMNQYNNYLYLTSGVDNIIRYDGSTTLIQYIGLNTPAAPAPVKTGLAGTSYSYFYKVSAVNQVGFSSGSAKGSVTVGKDRSTWNSTTDYVTVTFASPQASQTRMDLYISEDDVDYYYLNSVVSSTAVANVTFIDDGSSLVVPGTKAPAGNTTQGPLVEELVNVGSRMYGVRDKGLGTLDRYNVWFTSGAAPLGAFSNAYDGGYLQFQPGGKYIPKQVVDYRDGKGTPLATVYCDSADGQGCLFQMSLDTLTVADVSVTVPSAYKLPGSRGTSAPGSVVNVLNDYMFYNSQAFYNLGSRAQFLNLLSTDEASANIRPDVKRISTTSEAKIASVYFDARVYFSVPFGSTTNNTTIIFDTERKAWLPSAFTIGFKKFLRYTSVDTDGTRTQRLLAIKPGDTQLSEIGENIQGDYGQAFVTSLATGLYPTNKNRFEFQFTEEAEVELSNPQGSINLELSGIERGRGFASSKTATVTVLTSSTGWDCEFFDTTLWDDTSDVTTPYSESSTKRYFTIQKELNALQWRVTTNSLDARYRLRTLQTWGTATNAGKPRAWRL